MGWVAPTCTLCYKQDVFVHSGWIEDDVCLLSPILPPHPALTASSPHHRINSSSHHRMSSSSHVPITSASHHVALRVLPLIALRVLPPVAVRGVSLRRTTLGSAGPALLGDPSSFWSAALLTAGLLPCGPSDRPTVGHESHPGHAVWTLQCISMPLPHSRGRDGVQGCVAAGGLARIWAQSHLERPSC